mgnify:CR=1 FL=1
MTLTEDEERELQRIIEPLANDPKALEMKKYIQHSHISTYDHCMDVCRHCFYFVRRHKLKVDEEALVRAAFLHDYYLYDWHTHGDKLHGYHHAKIAMMNARRDFNITELESEIIKTHMWPLNLMSVPSTKEALLLSMADKFCSARETLMKYGFFKDKDPASGEMS